MLILPKVPHHLRTLTSSVSRLINPAASSSGSAAAGPSVTFTSSAAGVGNPIIGGGGPFTSNSFLVGGGALTKTGEHAGSHQLGFGAWAPYSGGTGGGAGAGRKAGTGPYGYTGHARAFISSAPTAADISNSLLEDDDKDLQATLALHRSRLRSPSGSGPASAHIRLQPDSLKVIRPQATLRIEDGRQSRATGEERVRLRELMRERSRRQQTNATATLLTGDSAREPASAGLIEDGRFIALDEGAVRRPRGRSITAHGLPFGRSASSVLLSSNSPATGFAQARGLSSTPPAASSLQSEAAARQDDELIIFSDDFDSSVNTLAPASAARTTTASPGSETPTSRAQPLEDRPLPADLPPVTSLPPPPQSSSNETGSSLEARRSAAPESAVESASPLGLGLGSPPPGLSLPSRIGADENVSMDLTEPEPTLPQSVPEGYVDPAEVAHLDSLREAHYSASIPDLIESARAYNELPGIQPAPGHGRLPIQSTESFTATLKALVANRPPGAPVDEITAVWAAMLRKGVAPSVEAYAVMIRVLCQRQLEVAETAAFAAADAAFVRKTTKTGEGERTNLLPEPVTYRFASQLPVAAVCEEKVFKQAYALFSTASTFPTLASAPLPIETYDALLAACAAAPGPVKKALTVFSHLRRAVESGAGLAYSYESFAGLIAAYAKAQKMQDAETVLEGLQSAEKEGLVVVPTDTSDVDALRIAPWNAMIAGHFKNADAASAVAVVENLIAPTTATDAIPPPAIQPSTFTAVIRGFLANDDLSSALTWFDRVAVADNALPPLEPLAYIALLAHASLNKDLTTFDHVFDRLTAHPPAGYHLRPLDVAEAVKLHLAAAADPKATAEKVNSHIDRIFEFVGRCDRHEHSRYLYPALLADPLLRLLVEHARIEELQEVYARTLQAGQEDVIDPLAAVKFHAFFFESIVHWLTTPHAKPLPFSVTERLELLGLVSFVARQAGLPTDLTGEQISDRVLHLYEQAHIEAAGAPFLSEAAGLLIADVEALMRHQYEAANPDSLSPTAAAASEEPMAPDAASAYGDSVAGTVTDLASQAGTDYGTAQTTTASSVTTETPPSSLNDDLIAPPSSIDDVSAAPVDIPAQAGDTEPVRYIIDPSLGPLIDAYRTAPAGPRRPTVLDGYRVLQRALQRGTVPSVGKLATLIGGLGRAREPEKAAEVLDLAHRVLLQDGPRPDGVRLWYQIENQAIIAFAHCGIMDRANFHRMNIINSKAAPSPDAYSALVNAAKDTTDDAAVARLLFQEALSLGVEPNLFLYNTVISALSKARKSDEAIGLFHDMVKKGLEPSTVTYGTIVNAFCRTGDPVNAIKFFDIMCKQPKFKARVPPFNTMMQYFTLTQPDRARVLHYYDRLVEADVQPSSHTYNTLMQAFGTIEPLDLRAMHRVFDTLRKNPHADARVEGLHWATLINCHGAVNKDLDTALQVFDTIAEHNAPELPFGQRGLPDAVCWEAIFNVILIHRRFDLLVTYIDRLAASGLQATTYIQNVLIRALATEGNIEKARELFESMTDPPMGIAAPHAHPNRKSRAKPAASVPPPGVVHREPSTYEVMVRAELAAGERERALRLCERMEDRLYPVSVVAKVRGVLGEYL